MNSLNMRTQSYFIVRFKIVWILYLFLNTVSAQQGKINGLSIVAPPSEFTIDPFPRIMETNADWVCLIPYGHAGLGSTEVLYNLDSQWWGEREVGVRGTITLAQKNNLKTFLKPQVYVPGSWPGDIEFEAEEDWLTWEKNYREFILFYADIASAYDVDMFCIGTEFKKSIQQRPQFWRDLSLIHI